jgi:universal stress protein A
MQSGAFWESEDASRTGVILSCVRKEIWSSLYACFCHTIELAFGLSPAMTDEISHTSDQELSGHETSGADAQEKDHMYRRILVPVDFSDHSKTTISYAKLIAVKNDSTLYVLHVFQAPDYVVTPYTRRAQNSAEIRAQVSAAEQDARENLEILRQELLERGVKTEVILRIGYPFEEIVLVANHLKVDLIVIGSHGRSGISRLLLGSTTERVVQHADCPVLVVKGSRARLE